MPDPQQEGDHPLMGDAVNPRRGEGTPPYARQKSQM